MLDPGHAIGWRIWAWAKLVKVWGSLRWSDLQTVIPAELSLVEGRLVTTLRRRTLYRDRACRSALAVVPRASLSSPMNPLQGSGVSERSRCGAAPILPWTDEPSTGIGRVGALSLWCRAHP